MKAALLVLGLMSIISTKRERTMYIENSIIHTVSLCSVLPAFSTSKHVIHLFLLEVNRLTELQQNFC